MIPVLNGLDTTLAEDCWGIKIESSTDSLLSLLWFLFVYASEVLNTCLIGFVNEEV